VPQHEVGVLLVGHPEIDRIGLKTMIEVSDDLTVVGEASSIEQGVSEAVRLAPDVIVVSLALPDGSAAEACQRIREELPDSRIVVLTAQRDEAAVYPAIMAGSAGYIRKDMDSALLRHSLITVADGGSLLDPDMTTSLLDRLRGAAPWRSSSDLFASLTPREAQILTLLGSGLTNRQIARDLSFTEGTIRNYVSRIYSKLHVERRSQAARLVTERRVRDEQM